MSFSAKQATLIRRSTVISIPLQLVFLGGNFTKFSCLQSVHGILTEREETLVELTSLFLTLLSSVSLSRVNILHPAAFPLVKFVSKTVCGIAPQKQLP